MKCKKDTTVVMVFVLYRVMKKYLAGTNHAEDRAMMISNSSGLSEIEYRLDEIRMKKYLYTADSGKIAEVEEEQKEKGFCIY